MFFLISSIVVFWTLTYIVPKRLSRTELYAIAAFSIIFGLVSDITFDLKYDLYGYFSPGLQLKGFLPIIGLFPTSGVLFMNFFPYHKSLLSKLAYILFWTAFSLIFEFFSVKSGYFYHNRWNYWYSAAVYPLLFLIQLAHLHLFRKFSKLD